MRKEQSVPKDKPGRRGVTVELRDREGDGLRSWFIPEPRWRDVRTRQAEIVAAQATEDADDEAAIASAFAVVQIVMRDVEGWSEAYPDTAALEDLGPSDTVAVIEAWTTLCSGGAAAPGAGQASFRAA